MLLSFVGKLHQMISQEFPSLKAVDISLKTFSGREVIHLYIPIVQNGKWNDEYRCMLDRLCKSISELGLRYVTDYPGNNCLVQHDENGEPWMCFNGGEGIELELLETQIKRYQ